MFQRAPYTCRCWAIYHKMEHVYEQRGDEGAENELILLFPCQKGSGKTRTVGCFSGRNITVWRRTHRRAIEKGEDTLTNQIWLHLHVPKQIIGVGKLKVDYLLCVRKWDDD